MTVFEQVENACDHIHRLFCTYPQEVHMDTSDYADLRTELMSNGMGPLAINFRYGLVYCHTGVSLGVLKNILYFPDQKYYIPFVPTTSPQRVSNTVSLPIMPPGNSVVTPQQAAYDAALAFSNLAPLSAECSHVYKTYTGLFEAYDYCTKCDEKKKS